MIDRLDSILGIERLAIRHLAAAHDHAAHLTATLHGFRCATGLACILEIGEQIGALSWLFYAGKGHSVSRNEVLRVFDPFVECDVIPDDAGGLHDGRIAREARQSARLSVPDVSEARAGHVSI